MFSLIRLIFMKNNLKYSLPALILIVISAVGFSWRTVEDDKEKMVMRLLYDALSSIHYEPKDFDDDLSSQVFDFYIDS